MERLRRLAADDRGISLLELLAALALLSIVASGILLVFGFSVSTFNREELQAEAQYDARLALDRICLDIRGCKNLGDMNPGSFEVRDKDNQPVPAGTEITSAQMPMRLYLEKTEIIDGTETDCTIIYLVNSIGQLCRQCRVFSTGAFKSSTAITVNRVNVRFSQEDGVILAKIIILDEEDNQVFELGRTCKPRMD